jgi:hypothetical protein
VRIVVSGTRRELSGAQQLQVHRVMLDAVQGTSGTHLALVHGGCPTGVDAYVAAEYGTLFDEVVRRPAQWDQHGRHAGPIRNREMLTGVEYGTQRVWAPPADLLVAFPLPARADSRGTWGTIDIADELGIGARVEVLQ